MTKIKMKGQEVNTFGTLPDITSLAHDFTFTKADLSDVNLYSFKGKQKLLNIFPSIDTGVCAASVRRFNEEASRLDNVVIINLSMDLPFAQKRFCGAEGINNVEMGSLFRSDFFKHYPLQITDGALKGLCSRVVILINDNNEIKYTEQVADIASEPNYAQALDAIRI